MCLGSGDSVANARQQHIVNGRGAMFQVACVRHKNANNIVFPVVSVDYDGLCSPSQHYLAWCSISGTVAVLFVEQEIVHGISVTFSVHFF